MGLINLRELSFFTGRGAVCLFKTPPFKNLKWYAMLWYWDNQNDAKGYCKEKDLKISDKTCWPLSSWYMRDLPFLCSFLCKWSNWHSWNSAQKKMMVFPVANLQMLLKKEHLKSMVREPNLTWFLHLRLHASYGAKITKNLTPLYVLLDYFITRPSFKNLNVHFLTKSVDICKAPSGGRAEIEYIKNSPFCDIFNFSSATRGLYTNVGTLLASMATWSKNVRSNFWKTVWL